MFGKPITFYLTASTSQIEVRHTAINADTDGSFATVIALARPNIASQEIGYDDYTNDSAYLDDLDREAAKIDITSISLYPPDHPRRHFVVDTWIPAPQGFNEETLPIQVVVLAVDSEDALLEARWCITKHWLTSRGDGDDELGDHMHAIECVAARQISSTDAVHDTRRYEIPFPSAKCPTHVEITRAACQSIVSDVIPSYIAAARACPNLELRVFHGLIPAGSSEPYLISGASPSNPHYFSVQALATSEADAEFQYGSAVALRNGPVPFHEYLSIAQSCVLFDIVQTGHSVQPPYPATDEPISASVRATSTQIANAT